MRLEHLDRQPGGNRSISQQPVATHNFLVDLISRKIYECCGIREVMRKDLSQFSCLCNPHPQYENLDHLELTATPSPLLPHQCAHAFFLVGGNITIDGFHPNLKTDFFYIF